MPTLPGGGEWVIILLIFVLLFGAKKLPELSRSMGQSISSFKKGVREANEEADADERADEPSGDADGELRDADEPRNRDGA